MTDLRLREIIRELQRELERVDHAIAFMERMAGHGRPPQESAYRGKASAGSG